MGMAGHLSEGANEDLNLKLCTTGWPGQPATLYFVSVPERWKNGGH